MPADGGMILDPYHSPSLDLQHPLSWRPLQKNCDLHEDVTLMHMVACGSLNKESSPSHSMLYSNHLYHLIEDIASLEQYMLYNNFDSFIIII